MKPTLSLKGICGQILNVEHGLMYGTIRFSYDNMMSAIKPGHPADILDEILSLIYFDVIADRTPTIENVKTVSHDLKEFKKCFKVKDLNIAIESLDNYIANKEKDEK